MDGKDRMMAQRMVVAIALGALAVAAVPGAAKDLPRGRTAARPATGCEGLGPGFQKLEGSDTCVRISGSVRAETSISTGAASFWPGARH